MKLNNDILHIIFSRNYGSPYNNLHLRKEASLTCKAWHAIISCYRVQDICISYRKQIDNVFAWFQHNPSQLLKIRTFSISNVSYWKPAQKIKILSILALAKRLVYVSVDASFDTIHEETTVTIKEGLHLNLHVDSGVDWNWVVGIANILGERAFSLSCKGLTFSTLSWVHEKENRDELLPTEETADAYACAMEDVARSSLLISFWDSFQKLESLHMKHSGSFAWPFHIRNYTNLRHVVLHYVAYSDELLIRHLPHTVTKLDIIVKYFPFSPVFPTWDKVDQSRIITYFDFVNEKSLTTQDEYRGGGLIRLLCKNAILSTTKFETHTLEVGSLPQDARGSLIA